MKKTLTNVTLDFKSTVIFHNTSGFARFSLSKSRCGIKTYEYKVGHWGELDYMILLEHCSFTLESPPDAAAILAAAGVIRTVSHKRKVRSLRRHFDPADLASLKFIPHQRFGQVLGLFKSEHFEAFNHPKNLSNKSATLNHSIFFKVCKFLCWFSNKTETKITNK